METVVRARRQPGIILNPVRWVIEAEAATSPAAKSDFIKQLPAIAAMNVQAWK
jgi:hypothetical protein